MHLKGYPLLSLLLFIFVVEKLCRMQPINATHIDDFSISATHKSALDFTISYVRRLESTFHEWYNKIYTMIEALKTSWTVIGYMKGNHASRTILYALTTTSTRISPSCCMWGFKLKMMKQQYSQKCLPLPCLYMVEEIVWDLSLNIHVIKNPMNK